MGRAENVFLKVGSGRCLARNQEEDVTLMARACQTAQGQIPALCVPPVSLKVLELPLGWKMGT